MPSTPTPSLRLNLQETGEGLNTWGERLNESLQLVEDAVTKVLVRPLTGNTILTTALYQPDEARSAALVFTDGGLTADPIVTVPAVQKLYYIENRCSRPVSLTAGGDLAVVPAGRRGTILTNGEDCWFFDPVQAAEAITQAIADQAAFSAQAAASAAGTATTRRDQAEAARDVALAARDSSIAARDTAIAQANLATSEAARAQELAESVDGPAISARIDEIEAAARSDRAALVSRAYALNLHHGS